MWSLCDKPSLNPNLGEHTVKNIYKPIRVFARG